MTRFLTGICAAAVAGAFSIAAFAPASATPAIVPDISTSASHVVQVDDGDGIAPDSARIIRRDRHRDRRGEKFRRHHEGQKQVRRHHDGPRQAHRRDRDKRFARRHYQDDRLGYKRARPGERLGYNRAGPDQRLGYNRSHDRDGYADGDHKGPRHFRRHRDDRRQWRRDDFYDGYRHKRRLYKMESFGYSAGPDKGSSGHRRGSGRGGLGDILTAVPD